MNNATCKVPVLRCAYCKRSLIDGVSRASGFGTSCAKLHRMPRMNASIVTRMREIEARLSVLVYVAGLEPDITELEELERLGMSHVSFAWLHARDDPRVASPKPSSDETTILRSQVASQITRFKRSASHPDDSIECAISGKICRQDEVEIDHHQTSFAQLVRNWQSNPKAQAWADYHLENATLRPLHRYVHRKVIPMGRAFFAAVDVGSLKKGDCLHAVRATALERKRFDSFSCNMWVYLTSYSRRVIAHDAFLFAYGNAVESRKRLRLQERRHDT